VTNTQKPRLLIVSTTFPRWKDDPGPAPFVFHFAKAMLGHFQVTVLAPHHRGAAAEEDMDGVRVKRFRYAWPDSLELLGDGAGIRNNMRKGAGHAALAGPLVAAEHIAIAREVRPGRYDFINSHWLVPSGLLVSLAAPRSIPHVITVHAADYDLLRKLPGGDGMIRFMASRARAIVCVSRRFADEIEGIVGGRTEVVTRPMGVDVATFAGGDEEQPSRLKEVVGPGSRVVLFVGKLSPKKGVEVLIRAAAMLKHKAADARFVIVGDGELRGELERLAVELGVDEVVSFIGAVPNRELGALYRAAWVVAVPSVQDERGETEGMPVVILEALASGTPVVASDLCSAPEDLVGRGVVEFEAGDAEALAGRLGEALAGDVVVDEKVVARYDLKAVADRYASLFLGDGR